MSDRGVANRGLGLRFRTLYRLDDDVEGRRERTGRLVTHADSGFHDERLDASVDGRIKEIDGSRTVDVLVPGPDVRDVRADGAQDDINVRQRLSQRSRVQQVVDDDLVSAGRLQVVCFRRCAGQCSDRRHARTEQSERRAPGPAAGSGDKHRLHVRRVHIVAWGCRYMIGWACFVTSRS